MIVKVDESNIFEAAVIHSASWKESHKSFCTPEFVELHSVERQKAYLEKEMTLGKDIYMLIADEPVGIVSIQGSFIENLYVKPEKQHMGYGTELLKFAISKCVGTPTLWILNNNETAYQMYFKYGFRKTGKVTKLSETLSELEMQLVIE